MPCIVCRAPGSPLNPQPILLTEASLQDEPVPIITLTMCLLLLWARAAVVDSSSGDKSSTNAPSEMKGMISVMADTLILLNSLSSKSFDA